MIRWLLCLLGFHDWDGHTDPTYPAPQCRRCKKWHPLKKVEEQILKEARMRYPQHYNPDGTIKKKEW